MESIDMCTRLLSENAVVASEAARSTSPMSMVLFMIAIVAVLGAASGAAMGMSGGIRQIAASAVKVPLLYLGTLAICGPALFVGSGLLGSALGPVQLMAMLLVPLALSSMLLASFAPVAAFFAFGSDYHFLKLLHVAIFMASGGVGMWALANGAYRLAGDGGPFPIGAMPIIVLWMLVFGFVGGQMAWRLRPFIGSPDLPFQLFRLRRGETMNFYTAVLESIRKFNADRSE